MLSKHYLDKKAWSSICEISTQDLNYYEWIPKQKESTRAVKNRYKNVYKLLQVARDLPNILYEIVTLLDHKLFCSAHQSDLQHTINLVTQLNDLHNPFGFEVKSKTALYYLYQDANWAKERSFADLISHTVKSYFRNSTVNINSATKQERADKIINILMKTFENFVNKIVLLAISCNYDSDVKFDKLISFECGTWAIHKVLENILCIVNSQSY